ncbi:hypothetical protein GGX14DRAFT_408472 [Mycena pura]|uniref:Uncharacterized protein n=1 Tax=Mycena pura TaxID=153505 RepID=A0AAD6Y3D8_9AGAR|nr:hypothetical protein GGX14DRAFT_408472 [Mycena pura]
MPAIRQRRRLICAALVPLFSIDDAQTLHLTVQAAASRPIDLWLSCLSKLRRQHRRRQTPRPNIGGTQISLSWLRNLSPQECLYRFRFYVHELESLVGALDIPEPFKTSAGYSFSRLEALCLLLARFKSAGNIFDLSIQYNRGATSIADVVNELTIYLDDRWKNLLQFDTDGILSPTALQQYADAIHSVGAPLKTVWGFIDCTIRSICRPIEWQRQAYSGYKKHG